MLLAAPEARDIRTMRPEHEERDHGADDEQRRSRTERDEQQSREHDRRDQAAQRDVAGSEHHTDEYGKGDRHRDRGEGEEDTRGGGHSLSAPSQSEEDRSHVSNDGGDAAGDRPHDGISRTDDARRKQEYGERTFQ